jgi:hypothetical protein
MHQCTQIPCPTCDAHETEPVMADRRTCLGIELEQLDHERERQGRN